MHSMDGRVVLITGADGNLGRATAAAFRQAGAALALLSRKEERLRRVHAGLQEGEGVFFAPSTDLTDPSSAHAAAQATLAHFGRLDVLVNTVGGYQGGAPVHQTPLEVFQRLFDLNVKTLVVAVQAVVPAMIEAAGGAIVNVAARPALQGFAGSGAYAAAKAAVMRLTESMAAELRPHRIRVNCALPGTLDTPQNREALAAAKKVRWVAAPQVADLILFLASPAAAAISGASIPAYGGA